MSASQQMPVIDIEALEAVIKVKDLAGQVSLEIDGDSWYCGLTLNANAVEKLTEWLMLYRLSK